MLVTPTLHFRGDCEQAIRLYERAFGYKAKFILRYRDADPRDYDAGAHPERLDCVYHSEGEMAGQRFMMGDDPERVGERPNSIFLTITFDTAEEVRRAFHIILADGGEQINALASTTYSSCMGTVRDRFGFRWGLMTEQTER